MQNTERDRRFEKASIPGNFTEVMALARKSNVETVASTHPKPIPDGHHRKIELQSPLDLAYLQSNLAASARQKLDLHFPPLSASGQRPPPATVISLDGVRGQGPTRTKAQADEKGAKDKKKEQDGDEEEDPLRAHVRQLVDAFMARMWEGAVQNITVNGMDAPALLPPVSEHTMSSHGRVVDGREDREGIDFAYEAYDGQLQARVASLYAELEALTAQVSRLRREAPQKGAALFEQSLRKAIDADEEEMEGQMEETRRRWDGGESHQQLPMLDGAREDWLEDAKDMYERGVQALARLAGLAGETEAGRGGSSLTETVGKVQRARTVAMEFE